MNTTESKGGMTVMQKIIAADFGGKLPTLGEIITKFPPKEEMIKVKDGTDISMMVSRASNEAGTILYVVPSAKWASVRERLFKEPS